MRGLSPVPVRIPGEVSPFFFAAGTDAGSRVIQRNEVKRIECRELVLSHTLWQPKSEATNLRRNRAGTGYYLRRRQLV